MVEYIERETFIESQQHLYCENCARRKDGKGKFVYDIGDASCRACDIMDVLDAAADFPAADVRPVVLCRDCVYFVRGELFGDMVCDYHYLHKYHAEPNEFCSHAEKREES